MLESVGLWRGFIIISTDEIDKDNPLKRELAQLLVSMYVSKQRGATSYEVSAALRQRQIPLPEPIYAFLFAEELPRPKRFFAQALRSIRLAPRRWVRKWSGRDVKEYYQNIQAVLTFMETSLEMKNDDG
jgi:hypothetical protein